MSQESAPTPGEAEASRTAFVGGIYAFSAYVLWGFLPIYFVLLAPTGPWEVVAWRILLSFVFCVLLIVATRSWERFRVIIAQKRLLMWTALAGFLVYINWQVFLIGTLTGHVIEASLGYFINPIVTVLLGVLVLRERLRPTQWAALGLAAIAVLVIVVGYGNFPWIALTLAFSFGAYGLVKKHIGPSVDAVSGLTLESFWLAPLAVLQLVLVGTSTGITMFTAGLSHGILLAMAGVITAVPLLLFAAGARRVPMTVLGILQFAAPIIQFVFGAWILGEPMPLERWIGFSIVWLALIVLTIDSLRASRRQRRARRTHGADRDTHGVSDVAELT